VPKLCRFSGCGLIRRMRHKGNWERSTEHRFQGGADCIAEAVGVSLRAQNKSHKSRGKTHVDREVRPGRPEAKGTQRLEVRSTSRRPNRHDRGVLRRATRHRRTCRAKGRGTPHLRDKVLRPRRTGRDRLDSALDQEQQNLYKTDAKRIYYLSAEFCRALARKQLDETRPYER